MPHTHSLRVYAQDTDHGGVVHHSNYLRFMERARAEWAYANGVPLDDLATSGQLFVVRDVNIRYHRGATLGAQLDVVSHFKKIGHASVVYHQAVCAHRQHDVVFASADITLAFVNAEFKPQAFSAQLKETLTHEPQP